MLSRQLFFFFSRPPSRGQGRQAGGCSPAAQSCLIDVTILVDCGTKPPNSSSSYKTQQYRRLLPHSLIWLLPPTRYNTDCYGMPLPTWLLNVFPLSLDVTAGSSAGMLHVVDMSTALALRQSCTCVCAIILYCVKPAALKTAAGHCYGEVETAR